jgi:hypothetical protein
MDRQDRTSEDVRPMTAGEVDAVAGAFFGRILPRIDDHFECQPTMPACTEGLKAGQLVYPHRPD